MFHLAASLASLFLLFSTAAESKCCCGPSEEDFKYLDNTVHSLGRQLMLQQFFTEERVRTEGSSGIKQIRIHRGGGKNYYSESHTGSRLAAMHNHANNIRTVGLGEFVAVMNGIEFRTRHNDYRLYMPHKTNTNYRAVEDVPFPDVPQAVLDKTDVQEQVDEMREWFKAWRDQDYSVRDYRKHFKPALCYLEGSWTTTGKNIDEPFHSDRHFLDAQSWFDLQEKIRITSYMGSKSRLENLAFLPTALMGFVNETIPVFAQWNYRILCNPITKDLPLNRFRMVEDFMSRMTAKRSTFHHALSGAARFTLNPQDSNNWRDGPAGHTLLDELMEEIPGANNYAGELYDTGLNDEDILDVDGKTKKDVSRYHRWYKTSQRDAMGLSTIHRGFSDDFMFAAKTTQERVAGFEREYKCKGRGEWRKCQYRTEKWTYALPLEIIYLTPLSKWNPYNLEYKGNANTVEGRTVNAGGRNGQCTDEKAYNGTNSRTFFRTPTSFFKGSEVGPDSADTSRGDVCVLDNNNARRVVQASGTRIFLPEIEGVGVLRTRYPIMPVHGEGSSVWKELNALRDYVMDQEGYARMKWNSEVHSSDNMELMMNPSVSSKTTQHTHVIYLQENEVKQIRGGMTLTRTTSLENAHQHDLEIRWDNKNQKFYYNRCDSKWKCLDGHARDLIIVVDDSEATV